MHILFHTVSFSNDFYMHPFTTGCSAMQCNFVLARHHGNSALVKTNEAGGGVQRNASIRPRGDPVGAGDEQRELMELWKSEWSRLFFSTENHRR